MKKIFSKVAHAFKHDEHMEERQSDDEMRQTEDASMTSMDSGVLLDARSESSQPDLSSGSPPPVDAVAAELATDAGQPKTDVTTNAGKTAELTSGDLTAAGGIASGHPPAVRPVSQCTGDGRSVDVEEVESWLEDNLSCQVAKEGQLARPDRDDGDVCETVSSGDAGPDGEQPATDISGLDLSVTSSPRCHTAGALSPVPAADVTGPARPADDSSCCLTGDLHQRAAPATAAVDVTSANLDGRPDTQSSTQPIPGDNDRRIDHSKIAATLNVTETKDLTGCPDVEQTALVGLEPMDTSSVAPIVTKRTNLTDSGEPGKGVEGVDARTDSNELPLEASAKDAGAKSNVKPKEEKKKRKKKADNTCAKENISSAKKMGTSYTFARQQAQPSTKEITWPPSTTERRGKVKKAGTSEQAAKLSSKKKVEKQGTSERKGSLACSSLKKFVDVTSPVRGPAGSTATGAKQLSAESAGSRGSTPLRTLSSADKAKLKSSKQGESVDSDAATPFGAATRQRAAERAARLNKSTTSVDRAEGGTQELRLAAARQDSVRSTTSTASGTSSKGNAASTKSGGRQAPDSISIPKKPAVNKQTPKVRYSSLTDMKSTSDLTVAASRKVSGKTDWSAKNQNKLSVQDSVSSKVKRITGKKTKKSKGVSDAEVVAKPGTSVERKETSVAQTQDTNSSEQEKPSAVCTGVDADENAKAVATSQEVKFQACPEEGSAVCGEGWNFSTAENKAPGDSLLELVTEGMVTRHEVSDLPQDQPVENNTSSYLQSETDHDAISSSSTVVDVGSSVVTSYAAVENPPVRQDVACQDVTGLAPQNVASGRPLCQDAASPARKIQDVAPVLPTHQDVANSSPGYRDVGSPAPDPQNVAHPVPDGQHDVSRAPEPQDVASPTPVCRDVASAASDAQDVTSHTAVSQDAATLHFPSLMSPTPPAGASVSAMPPISQSLPLSAAPLSPQSPVPLSPSPCPGHGPESGAGSRRSSVDVLDGRHKLRRTMSGQGEHPGDPILAVMSQVHADSEARLAARRQARAEAREIRMRELEKQQREAELNGEKSDDYSDVGSRSSLAGSRTGRGVSIGSSRRGSEEPAEDGAPVPLHSLRDVRHELRELEEKLRKTMVTSAQLDNDKSTLTYQLELLKDRLEELQEAHTQLQREHRTKCSEHEQLKRVSNRLKEDYDCCRKQLEERDNLIEDHGLVLVGDEEGEEEEEGGPSGAAQRAHQKALISQKAAELLEKAGTGTLDARLRKLGEEKNELEDQLRRLKLELEEERHASARARISGSGSADSEDVQREVMRQVGEYRFKLQKADQDITNLQASVQRLENQVARYKSAAETAEKAEEELKGEKRKLQRELREALNRVDDLETTNSHLQKRLDKLKNARSALLKDLSTE